MEQGPCPDCGALGKVQIRQLRGPWAGGEIERNVSCPNAGATWHLVLKAQGSQARKGTAGKTF